MNKIYRLIWNEAKQVWITVAETVSGKGRRPSLLIGTGAAAAIIGMVSSVWALDPSALPKGGSIVAGQGSISQSGNRTTVTQTSSQLITNWNSFNIGQDASVVFQQPGASSVALNRIQDGSPSQIFGSLSANGQVFLLNPSGIIFGKSAQVNVGGLVASSLGLANGDFLAGRYSFTNPGGAGSVVNRGTINAAEKGVVALIAPRVSNEGSISATKGSVLMAAGDRVSLDFTGDGLISYTVDKGTVDALVENKGLIQSDGGMAVMTAKTAGDLVSTVVNNEGVIEARTLENRAGSIVLLGDMEHGETRVSGRLDAGAPNGGDGGRIETSAAAVDVRPGTVITAEAKGGKGGSWLIDPYNYTIDSTAAANIDTALNKGTSVSISTQSSAANYGGGASGAGDITVSSPISKSQGGDASLTLQADHSIILNSDIGSSVGKLNLTLSAANAGGASSGGVNVNGNITSNGGNILIGGGAGSSTYGIGYALNLDASNPAVVIQQNKSILSGGGNITLNGLSSSGSSSGNYSGTTGGVYIKSGATLLSGAGDMFITGQESGGTKTFGISFEANSGTVTTVGSASNAGHMQINGVNTTSGATQSALDQGAIGLVNNGSVGRLAFQGPSVADWFIRINGSPQSVSYTYGGTACPAGFPNCGTLTVPGANASYQFATYQVVDMATQAIVVVQTASPTRTYDGTTGTSGLTFSSTGGPTGFSVSNLGTLVYNTPSKNVGSYATLIGNPNNVTDYTSGGTTYAVGYYNTGTYSITPKSLTPSASNKVYDGTTQASVSASGVLSGDNVTFNYTSGSFSSANVGSYNVNISGINLTGTDAGNYTLGSSNATATASITPAPITVSTGNVTKGYDGSTSAAGSAIVTSGTLYSNASNGNAHDNLSGGSFAFSNANAGSGNKTVTVSGVTVNDGNGGNNYSVTLANNTTSTINKAPLTITAASNSKSYDGSTSAAAAPTVSGTVYGTDSVTVLSESYSSKGAGSGKTLNVTGYSVNDGNGGNNYAVTTVANGTGVINKANLSTTGAAGQNKVYDGSSSATISGESLVGVVSGDDVSVSGGGSFTDKNAGSGKAITANLALSGNDAGNYSITQPAGLTANITKAPLTITAVSNSKSYDGGVGASATPTVSGLQSGDSVSNLSESYDTKNAGSGKTVSVSGYTVNDGNSGNNYAVSTVASSGGTIGKATVTTSGATVQNKVYDGGTSATIGGESLIGVVSGDSVSVSGGGNFSDKNVGTGKTVTASLALSGSDAGNYSITQPTGLSANITPKSVSTSGAVAQGKTYDGTTSATIAGETLAGVVSGDSVGVSGGGSFSDKNAGTGKSVSASLALSGSDAGNYSLTQPTGLTADVTPKNITASGAVAQGKTYDGTTSAAISGETLSGVVSGDNVGVSGGGSFSDKNAGTGKTVTANLNLSGSDAGNYSLTQPSGLTANVTPKSVTASGAVAQGKTYDGTTSATISGETLSGVVSGDTVSVSGGGAFSDKNAGTGKTVTANLNLSGSDAANYSLTQPTGLSADITPKTISASGAVAQGKTYDGTTTAAISGETLNGVVSGDNVGVSGGGSFNDKNAGTGKAVTANLNLSGSDAGNYALTQPAGLSADITPKTISATGAVAQGKTYDGTTAATISGETLNGVVSDDNVGVSGGGTFSDKNVGTGKTVTANLNLSGSDAGNYNLTQPTGLTADITPKTISASGAVAQGKTYDGTTSASISGESLSGVVSGDDVSVSGNGSFSDKNAGTGKTVTANLNLSGSDAGNYNLTQPNGLTADITPKTITASGAVAQGKTYDGTTSATISGETLNGVVSGDNVGVSGAGSFSDKNAGTGKTVTANLNLSGSDAGNYNLTQPTGLSADITPKTITASGAVAQGKTYDGTTSATISGETLNGVVSGDSVGVSGSGSFSDKNAGTGKAVTANLNLSGSDAGNYALTQPTGIRADITPKTITASGAVAQGKTYDGTTTAAISGETLNGVVSDDNVGVSGGGAFSDKNAGTGKTVTANLNLTGSDAGNYSLTQPTGLTADITPKTITASGAVAQGKTYDGTTFAAISGETLSGVVSGDTVGVTGGGSFSDKNAGNGKTVTANLGLSGSDAGNYNLTQPTGLSADITPKTITATGAVAQGKTYDGTTSASISGETLNGVVSDDNVGVSGGGTFSDKNAGTGKTVTANLNLSGSDAGNYNLTQPNGLTADITPKTITASGAVAQGKTYDGTTSATISGETLNGVVSGDSVGVSGAGSFNDKNAGTGKAVTANLNLSGSDAGNYALTQPAGLSADITPKTITATGAVAQGKTYDGTTSASISGETLNGVVSDDNVGVSGSGSFSDKNAGTGKTVTANLNLSGSDAGNYNLTQPTGLSADITPKTITASGAVAQGKTYDGTTSATISGETLSGVVSGDSVGVSGGGSFSDKNAGTGKTVTANLNLSGSDAGNYNLTQPTGLSADITPKTITATGAVAQGKTYDGTTSATITGETLSGVVSGDSVGVSGAGTFSDKNAGTGKTVTASLNLSGNDAGNYSLTQPTGLSADITPKTITASGAVAQGKTYDGTTSAAISGETLNGVVSGDSVGVSGAGSFSDKNAGTGKTVTASLNLSGSDAGNYNLTQPTGLSADITPKTITASGAVAQGKTYDGSTSASISGETLNSVVSGDSVGVSGSGSFSDKNAGTGKAVTANLNLSGSDAGNYNLTQPSGLTADITPKTITASGAVAQGKTYDGTTSATISGETLNGVVSGDSVGVSGGGTFSDKNAGTGRNVTANLNLSGSDAGNYNLTQPTGLTADIAPKTITASGSVAQGKTYDGTTSATISGETLSGVVSGDNVGVSGGGTFSDKNAGTGKTVTANLNLSGSDAGNYNLTQPAGLTADITPKTITASGAVAQGKTYDGTTTATISGETLSGVVSGDNVGVSGGGTFSDKNAGTGKTVTANLNLSGSDAGNYNLTQPAGLTADITPKTITASGAVAQGKTYDGTTSATISGESLNGVVSGDNVGVSGGGSFSDKNAGTGKTVTASLNLTGNDAGNYSITQPTGLNADIAPKTITASGAVAQGKTYDGTSSATITGETLSGVVSGDSVGVSGGGTFSDKNAGTGKTVTASLNLTGSDAGNYSITQPTGLNADIAPKTITASGAVAQGKTYDGSTTATISGESLNGVVSGDSVGVSGGGTFSDKNAGTGKSITANLNLTGSDAGNYSITQPTGLNADIAPKTITASGAVAQGKTYDGSTTATISGETLSGVVSGDSVGVSSGGTFSDKNAGTGKSITANLNLTGSDAGNYSITQPTGLTADITPKTITATGIAATDKVYDGSNAASLNTASAGLVGTIAGDRVSIDTSATKGSFGDAQSGSNKPVTVATVLAGDDAKNYVVDPFTTTANINAAQNPSTVSVLTSNQNITGGSSMDMTSRSASTTTATTAGPMSGSATVSAAATNNLVATNTDLAAGGTSAPLAGSVSNSGATGVSGTAAPVVADKSATTGNGAGTSAGTSAAEPANAAPGSTEAGSAASTPANSSAASPSEATGGAASETPKSDASGTKGQTLILDVHFDTNKTDLKPQYNEQLQKIADYLETHPNAKVTIGGHTDSVGGQGSNMKLSQRRAESVRDYLIKNFGIAPNRVAAKSFGSSKPIANNATKDGRSANRRIEAIFTSE